MDYTLTKVQIPLQRGFERFEAAVSSSFYLNSISYIFEHKPVPRFEELVIF